MHTNQNGGIECPYRNIRYSYLNRNPHADIFSKLVIKADEPPIVHTNHTADRGHWVAISEYWLFMRATTDHHFRKQTPFLVFIFQTTRFWTLLKWMQCRGIRLLHSMIKEVHVVIISSWTGDKIKVVTRCNALSSKADSASYRHPHPYLISFMTKTKPTLLLIVSYQSLLVIITTLSKVKKSPIIRILCFSWISW